MSIKNLLLLVALITGILFPYGHAYTYLIRYTITTMLLFAFLDVRINVQVFKRSHLVIWGVNMLIALAAYGLLVTFNIQLALTAFVTGMLPTAAAAAVISGYLNQDITYVTISILFTTCATALTLPFLLPVLQADQLPIQTLEVLVPVMMVVFVPLLLAQLIKMGPPAIYDKLRSLNFISFYLFILNVYIAMSSASHYIRTQEDATFSSLSWIALIAFLISVTNFLLGYLINPKGLKAEGSMSLGRKNTMFGVWVAVTFMHPIAALGPMFYIIFQNSWHSWLLAKKKN